MELRLGDGCSSRAVLILLLGPAPAQAAAPNKLNYQGQLLDPNGNSFNGNANILVVIWNDPNSVNT